MTGPSAVAVGLLGCALALCSGPALAGALAAADVTVFSAGRRLLYDVESGVTLNELGGAEAEVGFLLRAKLALAVLWPPPAAAPAPLHDDFLLHFEVRFTAVLVALPQFSSYCVFEWAAALISVSMKLFQCLTIQLGKY